MNKEELYEKIENGDYENGVTPRIEYDEDELNRIKTTEIGTWDELEEKIKEYKQSVYDVWIILRDAHYREQRKLNTQFEKDVIECYGMTGHPKSQEAFNIAREAGTVEEIIEQFGELSKLLKLEL